MTGLSSHDPTPDLVRRAADDELMPGETAPTRPDGSEPSGIRFERELRSAVGRVLEGTRAPAGLADRIREAMAQAEVRDAIHLDDARDGLLGEGAERAATTAASATASATATPGSQASAADAGGVSAADPAPDRMRFLRWLDSPRRANAAAVAAVIALVIGAIGFGITMQPITEWGQTSGSRFVERAAHYTANEHGRCTAIEVLDGKVAGIDDAGAARAFLAGHLNRDPATLRIPDFADQGYEFVGVAPCKVPGDLPSAHAVWRSTTPDAAGHHGLMSLFVTIDLDQFELQSADAADVRVRDVQLADGTRCERIVRVIRRDGLVMFVVCCDETVLDDCSVRAATAVAR